MEETKESKISFSKKVVDTCDNGQLCNIHVCAAPPDYIAIGVRISAYTQGSEACTVNRIASSDVSIDLTLENAQKLRDVLEEAINKICPEEPRSVNIPEDFCIYDGQADQNAVNTVKSAIICCEEKKIRVYIAEVE